MGARVPVLDPQGKFATVDEADVPNLPAGARVLTRAEIAKKESDEAYAQKSLGEKATSLASIAGPVPFAARAVYKYGQGESVAPSLPPELEAYAQGVSHGMTGGLATVAMDKLVEASGGKDAARAYAKNAKAVEEAHGGLYNAGQVAGLAGGAIAGGPIGGAGGAAEGLAARGLGALGVEGASVGGRALLAAGGLGARGAVEGALYGAANQYSENVIADKEKATDKVFAAMGLGALYGGVGGAALGAGGSLAKSALTAGATRASSQLERVLGTGAARAEEGGSTALSKAEAGAAEGAAKSPEVAKNQSVLGKLFGGDTAEEIAADRAFKATGARKAFVTEANARLKGGTKAVGEVLLRRGVISEEDGLVQGILNGAPSNMLPRAEAALAQAGEEIGAMTASSPATIKASAVGSEIDSLIQKYGSTAATKPAAESLAKFADTLRGTLGVTSPEDVIPLQKLLNERRALSNLVFEGPGSLNPSLQTEIKQELARKLEGLITKGLDEASGKVPGEMRAAYEAAKHDYHALRIARDALEDSVNRGTANRTFSLTDKIIGTAAGSVGSLVGGPVGGLIAGPGGAAVSKLVRERGDAAAALLLSRQSVAASVARAMEYADAQIGRAAKGLLSPPKAMPYSEPVSNEPIRVQAQKAIQKVNAMQADPERIVDQMTKATERMSDTHPTIANGIAMRTTQVLAYLASKTPQADPDPLDPHAAPPMNDAEAHEFVQLYKYAERPMRFFEDAERGKFSFEGAEIAQLAMPGAFAEMQARVADGLATMMAQGKRLPYQDRERIGQVMQFPATPAQRPDHMQFLQQNGQPATMQQGKPPKRPLTTKSQQTALDRLEGK